MYWAKSHSQDSRANLSGFIASPQCCSNTLALVWWIHIQKKFPWSTNTDKGLLVAVTWIYLVAKATNIYRRVEKQLRDKQSLAKSDAHICISMTGAPSGSLDPLVQGHCLLRPLRLSYLYTPSHLFWFSELQLIPEQGIYWLLPQHTGSKIQVQPTLMVHLLCIQHWAKCFRNNPLWPLIGRAYYHLHSQDDYNSSTASGLSLGLFLTSPPLVGHWLPWLLISAP